MFCVLVNQYDGSTSYKFIYLICENSEGVGARKTSIVTDELLESQ